MKLLRLAARVAAWTAWFFLASVGFAHAGPVIGAIGAVFTALGSLGVAGQFVLGLALKVGTSLLQRALAKRQEQPVAGVSGQLRVGGDNPLSFIVGTYATAGTLEYVNTWGREGKTPNAYLTMVISLSDLPVTALRPRLWVNGEPCTIDFANTSYEQGFPVQEFDTGNNNHLWVRFYDGTQTAPDPFLLTKFGADADRPWSADMIGRGVAYVIVTAQVNRELFSGVPQFKFEVDGIKCYDIRKDSTAGGSGPHRWGQPATYEWTDNPKVIEYNIIRGIYYDGQWVYGGQNTAAARLPASSWMAAMNECDRLIPLAAGGTEKQFIAGAEITVDIEPLDIVEELNKACNGRTAEIGGSYKTHVGAPPLPAYVFTDEDIVVTRGQSYEPFPGLENTYNGIQATYPEPLEAWANKDAPPRYNADYETQDDGRRLVAGASFPVVPRGTQVQRLMLSMANDARRFREHNFFLPPEAWLLEPVVDAVSWTSARNGYQSKLFLIGSMVDHPNCLQEVALKEVDPADYSWNPTDELPSSVGAVGPMRPPPQQMSGWQVQPAIFYDAAGKARRPSIEVFFDGDDLDVRAVRVQVRLAANGAGVFDGDLPYGDPATNPNPKSVILNGTFLPNTLYEVRGKFVPYGARATDWSLWLPVTTPNVLLGADDIYPIDIGQLNDDIQDALDWLGGNDRDIWDEIERLNQLVADQSGQNFLDKQELRREASVTAGSLSASFTEQITVAVSATQAVAQRVEVLEAKVADTQSGLQATATALDALTTRVSTAEGNITANSAAITQLTSQVGGVTADAKFRMETFASPGGGWSRIGAQTRASTADGWASAAWFLDSKSDGTSRMVIFADQFVVADSVSGAGSLPFLFQGGVGYLNGIKVNWADIVNANITWAQIENAVVNNFVATSANIGALAVDTFMLKDTAINVTNNFLNDSNITITSGGGFTTVGSTTLNVPADALNVRILWSHHFASGSPDAQVAFVIDGITVYTTDPTHDISAGGTGRQYFQEFIWMTPTAGVHTFEVRMAGGDATSAINTRRLQVQAQRR